MMMFKHLLLSATSLVCFASALHAQQGTESIDGNVVQMRLPPEDVTLYYNESRGGFTVELRTRTASIQAKRMFIGDGEVAIELKADSTNGLRFQGDSISQGFEFKRQAKVKVKPGYKKASDLKAGDLYVTLPSVLFDWPGQ